MDAPKEEALWQQFTSVVEGIDVAAYGHKLKEDPTEFRRLAVTAAVGVVTLVLLILFIKRITGRRLKCVLIVGPSNSGKTSLFSKLSGNDWIGTVPSLSPNFGVLKNGYLGKIKAELIDVPGSPGLAYHIPKHIKRASMVIFMIDGADFLQKIHETAEKMCQVLDDSNFKKRSLPMLIALNKSDLGVKCSTEKFVCSALQREIEHIRSQQGMGQISGKPFEFATLKSEVSISKISVILDDSLGPVHELLTKHMK